VFANSAPLAAASAAASAASATAAATSTASTTSAAASAASAATAALGLLFAEPARPGVFLVEDKERPQADVGNFFLIESDFGNPCGVLRLYVCRRRTECCGSAARQRQRHADDSQRRYNFLPTLSLRSLLRQGHSLSSMPQMIEVARRGRLCFA